LRSRFNVVIASPPVGASPTFASSSPRHEEDSVRLNATRRTMAIVSAALMTLIALSLPVAPTALPRADAATSAAPIAPPFWAGKPDSGGFRALTEGELRTAHESLDRLLAVRGPRTIA